MRKSENTKQKTLEDMNGKEIKIVFRAILDLVNIPSWAVKEAYDKCLSDLKTIEGFPDDQQPKKNLIAMVKILRITLEKEGIEPDVKP